MADSDAVFQGLFRQLNIIVSPTMELLVPLAHAAIELPPMIGTKGRHHDLRGFLGRPIMIEKTGPGLRVYVRLDEIAHILSRMALYGENR